MGSALLPTAGSSHTGPARMRKVSVAVRRVRFGKLGRSCTADSVPAGSSSTVRRLLELGRSPAAVQSSSVGWGTAAV